MNLRFIDGGAESGAFNMACDYYFARRIVPAGEPLLRLYTWENPTISLGFHQKTTEVDFTACENDGIEIVRRPTGGRAILHWGEITYCMIVPASEHSGKQVLQEIYRKIHLGILNALNETGAGVALAGNNKKPQPHNPLCFASSAGSELELGGKKVVGSAQRLVASTVLQHGSILLTDQHLQLPKYLRLPPVKREQLQVQLREKSTHLNLADTPGLRGNIAEMIAQAFTCETYTDSLSEAERSEIAMLSAGFRVKRD